jgi:dihydrofolate synthase/folylpolyglutamate synthase
MSSPDPACLQSSANLAVALERLYARHTFGIKLGLDPVRRLCELIGNPQDHVAVVHVAGTNGKGSVSAMIEAVLRAAGLATGLYTSPHMVRFNERIRIGDQDVSDSQLVAALEVCEQAAAQVQREQGHEATFFEITTAMAFHCFRQAGVQVAVVETGMGGRLDATNIVRPLASVITRIAMDHEAYLGNTLAAVAGEKAGIIKAGRPVVAGLQEAAAEEVLRQTAIARGAPYIAAAEAVAVRPLECSLRGQKAHAETTGGWSGTLHLPLTGRHQLENLAIALAALEQVFAKLEIDIPFRIIREGIASVRWRGRFEVLRENPTVIADAAHNPSGAATLAAALRAQGLTRTALVTGMCADKDTAGVARILAGVARRVWTVPIPNARSLPAAELAAQFRHAGADAQAAVNVESALREAEAWAKAEGSAVVIAGSIFLLGEVLPLYANQE